MLHELNALATPSAALLVERGQSVAVADGSTGGLISEAFCTVPGATKFFKGGGTLYSIAGRKHLFGLPLSDWNGLRGVTEPYALLQATAIRDNFGADWSIAESGSAGPVDHPHGKPSGTSCIAVAGPDGFTLVRMVETDSNDRIANMESFARAALAMLQEALTQG